MPARWPVTFFLFGLSVVSCAGPVTPDLVVTNARVFTADSARPWAEAIAVRHDRVVAIGARADIDRNVGAATRVLDAGGRVVVPGLNDAHVHVGVGPDATPVPLSGDPSLEEIAAALAKVVPATRPDSLLRGTIGAAAWQDERLTRDWLDARGAGRAVWLGVWTGHGDVLNSAALALAGVVDGATAPEGGAYGRDAAGRLNGRLEEYGGYLAMRRRDQQTPPDLAAARYRTIADQAVRYGITSVQLMSINEPVQQAVRHLIAADTALRWHVYRFPIAPAGATAEDTAPHLPPQPSQRIEARGSKWIFDGTPVERLAAVRQPYSDDPATRGRLNFGDERLAAIAREGYGTESQLAVHAVGDAAIDAYLTAMERAGQAEVWRRKRPRLEHGDGLTPDLVRRASALGVVVVQNPAHFLIGDVLAARLGSRAESIQPLRSLLDAGIPLALGSDGPLNPFLNISWATSHPARPSEALSREQAVSAYTRGAAYAQFAERDKGWLGVGTLADFAVLSDDVFTAPAARLPGITSLLTVIGGAIVYDAGVLAPRP
jgi:predicted amidohydrolase YtcJ